MIERIVRASHRWNNIIIAIVSSSIMIAMILMVADVSGRFLLNSPIRGSLEIEQILLAYISFIGLAYALIRNNHVRVTLLLNRLPVNVKMGLEIFAGLAGLAFSALVTWGGVEQFWDSWVIQEAMPASVELPFWVSKLALPVGTLLLAIQFIIYLFSQIGILLSKRKSAQGDKSR